MLVTQLQNAASFERCVGRWPSIRPVTRERLPTFGNRMGSELDISRFASIKPHSYKHTYVRLQQSRASKPTSPSLRWCAAMPDPWGTPATRPFASQVPYTATDDYRLQSYVTSRQQYDEVSCRRF